MGSQLNSMTFSDWIVDDLFLVYKEALERRSLGKNINKGIIKLLPKEGDKTLIRNWRPITLLNVSYKILAKVLAKRFVNILPKFINTQTGFIKGIYILENLITSWEAMEWEKASDQEATMVLLEFEKAYDRVEWAFIRLMLEAFSFLETFCNMVVTLFRDVVAQVDVNDSLT